MVRERCTAFTRCGASSATVRAQRWISTRRSERAACSRAVSTPAAFWVKIINDWIFNRSGLLAYNFLFAAFPLLILIVALTGHG
jgi:uncharacterized BrkB/YihY/UPF0761 family membrane protein